MKHGGFSIVEIVITIAILAILLTLGVVSMNGSQVNARDSERKADTQAISIHLESFYKNAMSGGSAPNGEYFMSGGSYPGWSYMNESEMESLLPEMGKKITRAPGVSSDQPISIVAATNTTQTTAGVTPQPTNTTYVYQPIQQNGTSLCADHFLTACRKFNIFYRLEKDNSVQMITSKNQ